MTYPVSWVLGWCFRLCLHDDHVLLDFLVLRNKVSWWYSVCLISPYNTGRSLCFLQFLFFKYWLHSLQDQFLRNLNDRARLHVVICVCLPWYFLILVFTIRMFCVSIWRHVLVQYVLWVDSTCSMYSKYDFAHNLWTCTCFLGFLDFILQ